jgi:hypothetical protein
VLFAESSLPDARIGALVGGGTLAFILGEVNRMRKLYLLAGAGLLLGCMDDASKSTAPTLDGAVVGASMDRGGNGGDNGQGHDDHDNNGGHQLAVTLLTGDEEVPPRETDARGRLTVKLSNDGQSLDYTLDVKDILNVTQAHIHMAAKGVNGGIVVWLFPGVKATTAVPGGGGLVRRLTISGTIRAADLRGALAGQPLSALVAAIQAGNTYGNVHTEDGNPATTNSGPGDFPGGEIRGQLNPTGHN